MKQSILRTGMIGAAVGTLALGPQAFATQMTMPAEQGTGDIRYVSGGVGEADAKTFEAEMDRYALAIELLERTGRGSEFTADATVEILEAGKPVLRTKSSGPFVLVNLPAGNYSVEATLAGRMVRKAGVVVAGGRHARARLEFPAHTD